MLVATPGQTTAYTLHNNNNGNTSSTTVAATKKPPQTSSAAINANNKQNSSTSTNNTTSTSSSSSASISIPGTTGAIKNHNNFSFHTPSTHKIANSSNDSANSNQQHSLKNSDNSKPISFISNLKDTVQKALVTTATSLSRNCNQTTTSAIKTNNSTSSNNYNNTSKSTTDTISTSNNVTSSSSLSLAVTTNKLASIVTASTTTPASSSSSTILPFSVARKKASLGIQPKLHTIPPTIHHRYPEERHQTCSTDSLQKEMCHFKPIRTVPTTPWKSGSKSRGSSLRFPKANLATTKSEFILKSNCDVNNRMKKKPPSKLAHNESETGQQGDDGDDNNDEQENKAYYERFKPKPSTLHLFADFETPNHQSAFVCLVAHMKNLINIQSTKMLASSSKGIGGGGSGLDLHKAKSTRIARSKEAAGHTTAIRSNQRKNIDIPITEIFVRPKKFKSPAPQTFPPASKKSDLASGNRTAGNVMQTPEVSKKMSNTIELSGKVTKAKSRRKLTGAKSNMINLVQLVKSTSQLSPTIDTGHSAADSIHNEILSGRRTTRKRKIAADIATNKYMSITNIPATPTLRSSTRASKNARLSNEMPVAAANALNNKTLKYLEINASRVGQRTASFSPPLTRSRLKQLIGQDQMSKGFTTPIVDIKKRKG